MPDPSDLDAAIVRLDRLVGTFENEPDKALRERVLELLASVDDVHRRLVWHVGERIWKERPELFEALLRDETAGILFEMYGLVAPEAARASAAPSAVIGLADLEASVPPPLGWYDAAPLASLSGAAPLGCEVEGQRLILVRSGDGARAYRDACPETPMPLNVAVVRDGTLLCPWHDCRFDVGTGERLDRDAAGLEGVPCDVRDGVVRVGLRVPRRSAA